MANVIQLQQEERTHVERRTLKGKMLVAGSVLGKKFVCRDKRCHFKGNVVSSEIQRFAQKHEGWLHHHENVQAILLLDNWA